MPSRSIHLAANRSHQLDAAEAFVVEQGHVLLFAVEQTDAGSHGQRHMVATLEPGDLLLGVAPGPGRPLSLLATGVGDAQIESVELPAFLASTRGPSGAESWVTAWCARIAHNRRVPTDLAPLADGVTVLDGGDSAHPDDGVRFVRCVAGSLTLVGVDAASFGPDALPVPVSDEAWVTALDETELETSGSDEVCATDWAAQALVRFTELALLALAQEVQERTVRRHSETLRLASADVESQVLAVEELAATLSGSTATAQYARGADPTVVAVRFVLDAMGLALPDAATTPLRFEPDTSTEERVRIVARAASARTRPVELPSRWWKSDVGPFVGQRADDGRAVAVLRGWRGYELRDPVTRTTETVDERVAATLSVEAITLYRPLAEEARHVGELLRSGLRSTRLDVTWMVVFGSFAGLASLLTPILTGKIFNEIVPADERGRLGIAVLTLALVAISVTFGSLARGIAFIRIRARISNQATSALWDRLLRLPAGFFSQHQTGALANRARAVELAQQILNDGIIAMVLNGVFSLFNLALLDSAGSDLLLVGIGLVLLQIVVIVLATLTQIKLARGMIAAQNRAQSLGLQLIRGINKLRVAAAERRAFATWAHRFTDQSRAVYRSGRVGAALAVFNTGWPAVTTLAVTGVVAAETLGRVTVGSYIEFTTALAQITSALVAMVAGLGAVSIVIPLLELPEPILESRIEDSSGREQPGTLSGGIEVSHVSFRYHEDGPLVLDDVSMTASPGEFIAIVGPSGAGKSSLVRLLLGFELPELGSVSYDDKDLSTLDTSTVRRQIGTVIQSARLLPGTVYSNIAGGMPITRDEAWEAAEASGVADDIRDMPMGMETVIVEGGGVVSGGQRQRILIARALALKPRVLLFDEATSALDNVTQAIVTRSLARLQVTRIVIAHRLTTVQDADRIYVMERGRVVQVGNYDELMAGDGVFRRLAMRQLV